MNKLKAFAIILFVNLIFFLSPVVAVDIDNPADDRFRDVNAILGSLSALVFPIATFIFLVMIIIGGFTKLTAAGDADKEAKAMKVLQAGIIGFVIIVLAPLIVSIVGTFLGVQLIGTSTSVTPTATP